MGKTDDFIDGVEVLEILKIRDFQIFEYLGKGLQPYDTQGREIVNADILERRKLSTYEDILINTRMKHEYTDGEGKKCYYYGISEEKLKMIAKEEFDEQPIVTIPPADGSPYRSYSLPSDKKAADEAIRYFVECLYKKGDAEKFLSEDAQTQSEERTQPVNIFKKEGEIWRIVYEGGEILMQDTKGLYYIESLLQISTRPDNKKVHVNELSAAKNYTGQQKTWSPKPWELEEEGLSDQSGSDAGKYIDQQALAEYEKRLKEIEIEIEAANDTGNTARAEELRAEKEDIEKQLRSASSLGGRNLKKDDTAEKARKAVSNRIKETIESIREQHPSLGQHLEDAIKTGVYCSYSPKIPTTWEF